MKDVTVLPDDARVEERNTPDEKRMRELWEEGRLSSGQIAAELGTTLHTVKGIVRRRGWIRGDPPEGKYRPTSPSVQLQREPRPSTLFERLAEVHAKFDRLVAETRVGRLHGR